MSDLTFADRLELVEDFIRFVMDRDLGDLRSKEVARVLHGVTAIWGCGRSRRISDQEVQKAIGILESAYPGHVLSSPGLYCAMERLMRFPTKEGQDDRS